MLSTISYVGAALSFPIVLLVLVLGVDQPIPAELPFWVHEAALTGGEDLSMVTLPWSNRSTKTDSLGVTRASANIAFQGSPTEQLWAVLIPRPLSALTLAVNGQTISKQGQMTVPVSWLRWPVLTEFSGGLLTERHNQLTITTAREGVSEHLPVMLIGPADVLRPHYERQRFFGVTIVRVVIVAMTVLALLIFGLFLLRPDDSVYGWFSLTLLTWSLHTLHDQIEWIPIANRHIWFVLSYLSLGWFVILSAIFVHRILAVRARRIELSLCLAGTLGSVVLLWMGQSCGNCFYRIAQNYWVPCVLLIGFYTAGRLLVHAWREPRPEFRWLGLAAWLACVVGVRDYLWEMRILTWGSTYYLAYASALVLVVFAGIILKRFADALGESEVLNQELEQRVANKAAQLKQNFQQLGRAERQRARLEERELIMRDMHDGLGGDLVQALAIMDADSSGNGARAAVQRCLDDLRLILDSSDIEGGDIQLLIATFRHRIERGLRRAGIELKLAIDELPVCLWLNSADSLHLLRILQEAVNNAVKHANATELDLGIAFDGASESLVVEVRDNGQGMKTRRGERQGRGLANIRWRADTIGADVRFSDSQAGTSVQIRLPAILKRAETLEARQT